VYPANSHEFNYPLKKKKNPMQINFHKDLTSRQKKKVITQEQSKWEKRH